MQEHSFEFLQHSCGPSRDVTRAKHLKDEPGRKLIEERD